MFRSKRPGFVELPMDNIPPKFLPTTPTVYILEDATNNKLYVGSTINMLNRMCKHKYKLKNQNHENKNLQKQYDSGAKFTLYAKMVDDREKAYDMEQEIIDRYKDTGVLLNASTEDVRNPRKGVPNSEDVKRRLSEANRGKPLSDETKHKLSLTLKGRKMSPEAIEKVRQANLNHPRREELNKALSDSRMSGDNPYAKAVIIDGVEYGSGSEASRTLGIPRSTLEKRLKSNKPEYVNYRQK